MYAVHPPAKPHTQPHQDAHSLEGLCTWAATTVCKDSVEQHQKIAIALLLDHTRGLPSMLSAVASATTAKTGACGAVASSAATLHTAPAFSMVKAVDELLRSMLKDLFPSVLVHAAPLLVAAANTLYCQPFRDTTIKRNTLTLLRVIVLLPGLRAAHPQLFDAANAAGLQAMATFRVV